MTTTPLLQHEAYHPPAVRGTGELIDLESWLARDSERRNADRQQHSSSLNAILAEAGGSETLLLHDRQRGLGVLGDEIAHLAVTSRGIWVIEARHFAGSRVDVVWASGVDDERERLLVNGHDRTLMVKKLDRQVQMVRSAMASQEVPVGALLCFVGATLPRVWTPSIHGYPVCDVDGTAGMLHATGPLGTDRRHEIHDALARLFPAI